ERFRWISRALALGLSYVGADFRFDPPRFHPFDLPSIAVIGTGKRVGKTAITGHLARLLARDRDVVVVAMGRGGPPEPELIETPPTLDDLLALSRGGRHAASDHLELAALTGVVTIGCRRAGGGLAGQVLDSNVVAGAALARSLAPDVVVFDGSGAAIPPIATSARILVTAPEHDLGAYLNPYRVAISNLVIGIGDVRGADVTAELRLRPASPLAGRRIAVFTTGPAPVEHLDAEIVHVSRNLADRAALRAELATVDAEVFLVELKAAAIDVVAEAGAESGAEVILAENEIVAPGLDDALLALIPEKVPV
ncbi:MAG: cyclic 2,3-diphosphoglycerate synthase, partial [Gaiellaceae bacterium]|nr:cyclic 2,3-diphosphoglycerate synthase [Gaiellaceae bacterium]